MRKELLTPYAGGRGERGICCAHCGCDRAWVTERHPKPYAYISCDCPGHLKTIIVGFDEMPDLPQRIEDFEAWLENEPCTNISYAGSMSEGYSACMFYSNSRRMCPACRLRLHFFHSVYNADAYKDRDGKVNA